jgi:hypothetical protein
MLKPECTSSEKKAASSKVQERPLGAVLIAFAVGFLGRRLL